MLNPELRERLWPFLGAIAKQNGITPRCIGGVADHVHLLLSLATTVPIAKATFQQEDLAFLNRHEHSTHSARCRLLLKNLQCHPIKIGGADDHVHILSSLSKKYCLC
jgi:hypothetical protein